MRDLPQDLRTTLIRLDLLAADSTATATPLTGGVSSDIWRVDLPDGPICVKRALAKLKVEADWQVPVERNRYEIAWLETVSEIAPSAAPRLLGRSDDDGLFAMEYLDPAAFPLWKAELMEGRADPDFAASVGAALGRIHAATADDAAVAARFDSAAIFHAIRLEPYLEATARRHPDIADALKRLVTVTARSRRALVHGDVSPKNILVGDKGPVFLDAECATFGDPAFDIAFCLNHLLLKCLYRPEASSGYIDCFAALSGAYLPAVDWEDRTAIERRVAHLLPGLLLARVDGKSPVEYLEDSRQHDCIRGFARTLLDSPTARLDTLRDGWADAIATFRGATA